MYKIYVMAAMATTMEGALYSAKTELGLTNDDFAQLQKQGDIIVKCEPDTLRKRVKLRSIEG